MAVIDYFENFDEPAVYQSAQERLLDPQARNFILEFGADKAKIGFNLDTDTFERRIKYHDPQRGADTPVRWINIWAPNLQTPLIEILADRYKFSRRFRAILKSTPDARRMKEPATTAQEVHATPKLPAQVDIELGNGVVEKVPPRVAESLEEANHYRIASRLLNYQSLDLSEKFLGIGANYMFHTGKPDEPEERVWSWLILCDDGKNGTNPSRTLANPSLATVISLHEDAYLDNADGKYMAAIRGHIMNVLRQLSTQSLKDSKEVPMSMVSIRMSPKSDDVQSDYASELSSNLFYYLFDNWQGALTLLTTIASKLEGISKLILDGFDRKHETDPKDIISGLYKVGKELRRNQHLYESYENIITRILRYRADSPSGGGTNGTNQSKERILVHRTASERFERLGDRIKLLVLSSISEAIAEKDALVSTYFSITAQKDSAATAKLSRNATLLSKLGVLFLPVSLMTSYFSVQIEDLQGVYSSKTYWICFAVIIFLSFIALFFMSRFLVSISESLEVRTQRLAKWWRDVIFKRPARDDD